MPSLRAKDYDAAILGAVGQVAQVIATDAHVTLSDQLPTPPPVRHRQQFGDLANLIPFIFLILIFCGFGGLRFLFAMGLLNSALGGRRGGGGPFMGGGGWVGGGGGWRMAAVPAAEVLEDLVGGVLVVAEQVEAGRGQGTRDVGN